MLRERNRLADAIVFVRSVEMKALALEVYMIILVSSHLLFIIYMYIFSTTYI